MKSAVNIRTGILDINYEGSKVNKVCANIVRINSMSLQLYIIAAAARRARAALQLQLQLLPPLASASGGERAVGTLSSKSMEHGGPVCLVAQDGEELRLHPDGVALLQSLGSVHVAVVAVAGLYRTGKSFILNQLAAAPAADRGGGSDAPSSAGQELAAERTAPAAAGSAAAAPITVTEQPADGAGGGLGGLGVDHVEDFQRSARGGGDAAAAGGRGFTVGHDTESCTRGIWVWAVPPHVWPAAGSDGGGGDGRRLLLLDSEGLASVDQDERHDAKIFSLAIRERRPPPQRRPAPASPRPPSLAASLKCCAPRRAQCSPASSCTTRWGRSTRARRPPQPSFLPPPSPPLLSPRRRRRLSGGG
eukprot:SAG11_NODE_1374_length_5090_cov_8.176718_2_plen_362_part_00